MGRIAILLLTIFLIAIPIGYSENYLVEEIELDTEGTALIQGKTNLDLLTLIDPEEETIKGYTAELTRKEGINWYFEYKTEETMDRYVVKLILPESTRINQVETTAKTAIEVENNKHALVFTGKNQTMDIKVQYSFTSTKKTSNIWMYTTIILAIVLIGLIATGCKYVKKKPKKEQQQKTKKELKIDEEKIKTIRLTLNEAQLKILDALQEKGGEASQTTIKYMTDLPKSSLSRNLEIMAQKNIISKFYNGTSNYVKIHPSLQTD